MKKEACSATDLNATDREQMTRQEYVQLLRQKYLDGTLDEYLSADIDIPDTLVADVFPELFEDSPGHL